MAIVVAGVFCMNVALCTATRANARARTAKPNSFLILGAFFSSVDLHEISLEFETLREAL